MNIGYALHTMKPLWANKTQSSIGSIQGRNIFTQSPTSYRHLNFREILNHIGLHWIDVDCICSINCLRYHFGYDFLSGCMTHQWIQYGIKKKSFSVSSSAFDPALALLGFPHGRFARVVDNCSGRCTLAHIRACSCRECFWCARSRCAA